jgi:hypothetical protein
MIPMSAILSARQLLRDSLPVPLILAVWVVPARLLGGGTGQALFVAGIAMVALYVVVRGTAVSSRCRTGTEPSDVAALLEENVRVLVAAAVWFAAAQFLWLAFSSPFGVLPDLRSVDPLGAIVFALNGAGAGVALLYAVAVGRTRLSVSADDFD